jgi:anti-anti-sigma factor
MEIIVTTENANVPVTILHVYGNIDSATNQAFQARAEEVISKGARHILIDMENAPFISSAGLRAIHNIFNQLRTIHKDADDDSLRKRMSEGGYKSPYIKVTNLSAEAKDVFSMGGFDIYIEVYSDRTKAIASFQAGN